MYIYIYIHTYICPHDILILVGHSKASPKICKISAAPPGKRFSYRTSWWLRRPGPVRIGQLEAQLPWESIGGFSWRNRGKKGYTEHQWSSAQ